MEVGYGSWVSSYAVMEKVATVEQATYTGSIFWISNTAFRIILIYVTIKVSLRLRILVIGLIISSVFNLAAALT